MSRCLIKLLTHGLPAERYPEGANYLCIDINYFPGYEKLPDYENLMSSFLACLFSEQPERQPSARGTRSRPGSAEAMLVKK